MNLIAAPTLRGDTVVLRPLSLDDAPALAEAAAESRDTFGFTRVPDGIDDATGYIEIVFAERDAGRRLPFAIVWHGRIVGSTSYLDVQRWRWPTRSRCGRCTGSRSRPTSATPSRAGPSNGWARASRACAGPTCRPRTAP
jgi:hypothetical protein